MKLVRASLSAWGGWSPAAFPAWMHWTIQSRFRAKFRMVCIPSASWRTSSGDGEIFVQHIYRGRSARPAGGGNSRAGLVGEGVFSGVEHPVQHGEDAAGGVGVIDRRTEHEAVRLPGLLNDWVHHIVIEHAAARRLLTGPAGGAIPDGAAAQKEDFRLRAAGFQRISDLPQGCVGAAVGPGAAINQQNFHVYACLSLEIPS